MVPLKLLKISLFIKITTGKAQIFIYLGEGGMVCHSQQHFQFTKCILTSGGCPPDSGEGGQVCNGWFLHYIFLEMLLCFLLCPAPCPPSIPHLVIDIC